MLKRNTLNFLQRKTLLTCKYLLSNTAETIPNRLDSFRTQENDPRNQTSSHLSKFYRISPETKKKIFQHGGFPGGFETQIKTFNENCVMIREASLDVINCMKVIDYTKPITKFVLYGKQGNGKTLSLAHILHYAHEAGFLIVHVPWVANWMRRCKEYCNSPTKEGFVDLPLDASAWLIHFKTQNQHILTNNDQLLTSQDYVWSKREVTVKNSPLLDVVDHGINRVKYASDCVTVIANELKTLSTLQKCRVLVAIDGFNSFFYKTTRVFTEKKEMVSPENISLTAAFLDLTKSDWSNGVAVLTVDDSAIREQDRISHLPKTLLGTDGFEHLDPFIPIHVPGYSDKELTSCMDYFRERKWIRTQPEQDLELGLLSAANPYKLMQICAPL